MLFRSEAIGRTGGRRRRDLRLAASQTGGRCRRPHRTAPVFERATGHKVIVSFEAGPSLMQKVNASAPADLVMHYPNVIDDLIKQGKVVGSRVDFARAGVGLAVKAGAPKPEIGTPEAFKHAMLAAKSIAYSTGASGIIAAKLMEPAMPPFPTPSSLLFHCFGIHSSIRTSLPTVAATRQNAGA